jgi:O-antigen/teichoic acid export membrane protein
MLATDLALMRLLAVEAFGLVAFGLMVVGAFALVRSMGVGEALIHSDRVDAVSRDTAVVMAVGAGLGLWGMLYVAAPWLGQWLAGEDASLVTAVMRLLGLVLVLDAVGGVPAALMERQLDFRRRCVVELAPVVVYAAVALGLALCQWGVWSLVWGRVAGALAGCITAWSLCCFRPGWHFDWGRARALGGYGRFVAGGSLLSFLVVNLDDAVLGRAVGPVQLGLYYKAYLWANLPATALAHIVNRVAFPAYARMAAAGDKARLYQRLVSGIACLALPFACGMVLLADVFVAALLDIQWQVMAQLLPWLAGYGLLRAILSNSGPLFNACGVPQNVLKVNALQLGFLGIGVYPLVERFGALGACWAVLAATMASAPLTLHYLQRAAGVGWGTIGRALVPWGMPVVLMGLVLFLGQSLLAAGGLGHWLATSALAQLLILAGAGGGVYGLALWRWRREHLMDCVGLLVGRGD